MTSSDVLTASDNYTPTDNDPYEYSVNRCGAQTGSSARDQMYRSAADIAARAPPTGATGVGGVAPDAVPKG